MTTASDSSPALLPDIDTAISFLKWHAAVGEWTLTAIPPDGGRTNTRQFDAEKENDCRSWLEHHHVKRNNIYFMVNPPIGHLKEKAMKEHVKELAWLHVDVDAKGNGDQSLTLAAILDRLRGFYPPPSAIIFSGGGYQAYWRLETALYLNGDLTACEDAEAYNVQLAKVLGGDHCHNVDRIMRLPGMINVPDAKKRKRGRVETKAYIVDQGQSIWPLSEFRAAPRVQDKGGRSGYGAANVKLPGNLPKIGDLEKELPSAVKDRIKALIVQGHDPTDPNAHGSRSEAVWAVICDLVRAEVPDDLIAGILLDKDFGISAHIYDQKRPVEYTARQIGRAKEEAVHPKLREMNERFAIVNEATKARVLYELPDPLSDQSDRTVWMTQSFEDFKKLHIEPVSVGTDSDGEEKFVPAGKWWTNHPNRRQYAGIGCWPNKPEVYRDQFNTWRGFAYEPIPGDCDLFFKHVHDNIARGNAEHYNYILNWCAFSVQHPEKPAEVGLVLRGPLGTGKGKFGGTLANLFGRHSLHISSSALLTGRFNAHLRECVFMFSDEALVQEDRQGIAKLKALVTEPTIVIEGKGKDVVTTRNLLSIVIASNDDKIISAGSRERRWAVFDVSEEHLQDQAYFGAIQTQLDNGGYGALLHTLLARDIAGWHPRQKVPQTDALRDQQRLSLTPEQSLLLFLIDRATLPAPGFRYASEHHTRKKPLAVKDSAYSDDLYAFAKHCVPEMEKWNVTKMGRMFKTFGCTNFNANGLHCWRFPNLKLLREKWVRDFGPEEWSGPAVWGSITEDQLRVIDDARPTQQRLDVDAPF